MKSFSMTTIRSERRSSIAKISYTLSSFFFVVFFIYIWFSISEIQFESLSKLGRTAVNFPFHQVPFENSTLTSPDLRILIGITTLPNSYFRRHLLRLVYGTQSPKGSKIDVKFVFCNLTNDDQRVLIALEIMRYDDIIILDCEENMNRGKTFTFFSSLPDMFNNTEDEEEESKYPPYDYVMKADDDTFFRLDKLVESVKPLPREDLYYGYVIPCSSMDPFKHYMSGMGYMVSWDIVEWIRSSDIPKNHLQGPEDKVFGDWMKAGNKGKNRYNAKWSMYNYPTPPSPCTHELVPETIAVHLLKNDEKWIKTLSYFNFTSNLKPSKLYHIP